MSGNQVPPPGDPQPYGIVPGTAQPGGPPQTNGQPQPYGQQYGQPYGQTPAQPYSQPPVAATPPPIQPGPAPTAPPQQPGAPASGSAEPEPFSPGFLGRVEKFNMLLSVFLVIALLVSGLVWFTSKDRLTVGDYYEMRDKTGVHVTAEIIDTETQRVRRRRAGVRTYYAPVYQFVTQDGELVTYVDGRMREDSFSAVPVGTEVPIVYDPNDLERVFQIHPETERKLAHDGRVNKILYLVTLGLFAVRLGGAIVRRVVALRSQPAP